MDHTEVTGAVIGPPNCKAGLSRKIQNGYVKVKRHHMVKCRHSVKRVKGNGLVFVKGTSFFAYNNSDIHKNTSTTTWSFRLLNSELCLFASLKKKKKLFQRDFPEYTKIEKKKVGKLAFLL